MTTRNTSSESDSAVADPWTARRAHTLEWHRRRCSIEVRSPSAAVYSKQTMHAVRMLFRINQTSRDKWRGCNVVIRIRGIWGRGGGGISGIFWTDSDRHIETSVLTTRSAEREHARAHIMLWMHVHLMFESARASRDRKKMQQHARISSVFSNTRFISSAFLFDHEHFKIGQYYKIIF